MGGGICAIQTLKIAHDALLSAFLSLSNRSTFLLALWALLFWGSSLLACHPVLGGDCFLGKVLVGCA